MSETPTLPVRVDCADPEAPDRERWQSESTFGGLWRARGLVGVFVERELRVRTRQAFFGVGWIALQPLIATGVLTLLVRGVLGMELTETSYPVFLLAGLLPWQLLTTGIQAGSTSVMRHRDLLTHVPFPRIVLPLYPLASSLIDLAIGLIALGILMACTGMVPPLGALLAPVVIVPALLLAYAVALVLGPISLAANDLDRFLPVTFALLLYGVPVLYPLDRIPADWMGAYLANPAVGLIVNFRSLLIDGTFAAPGALLWSVIVASVGLLVAVRAFRGVESALADVA